MIRNFVLLLRALALVAGCNTSRIPNQSNLKQGDGSPPDFSNTDASGLDSGYARGLASVVEAGEQNFVVYSERSSESERHVTVRIFDRLFKNSRTINITEPSAGVKCYLPQLVAREKRYYVTYTCSRPSFSAQSQVYLRILDENWAPIAEMPFYENEGGYDSKLIFFKEADGKESPYLTYVSNDQGVLVRQLDRESFAPVAEVVASSKLSVPYKTSSPYLFVDGNGRLALSFIGIYENQKQTLSLTF
ncbi:hypothetical protein K2X33_08325 [bacterium]|nr:hypothetical protein [bacterium]